MDLEELNTTQIILLVLLVSFVTSIATGIVTVTLMAQAPQAVTQTVNRVVERTIERVIPGEPEGPTNVITTEKETTVVVKEDDLITESIEKNRQKLVRIISGEIPDVLTGTSTLSTISTSTVATLDFDVVGLGVLVSKSGLVAVDPAVLKEIKMFALTSEGAAYALEVANKDEKYAVALLRILPTEEQKLNISPASFVSDKSLKLGQTVIALSGEKRTSVAIGIISALIEHDSSKNDTTTGRFDRIDTNISDINTSGTPLINIFGEFIGIRVGTKLSGGSFIPTVGINAQISEATEIDTVSDTESGGEEPALYTTEVSKT